MKIALILLLLASNCYAVEKLKAEWQVMVTILAQEQAEVTAESGTPVYDKDGNIIQVIF